MKGDGTVFRIKKSATLQVSLLLWHIVYAYCYILGIETVRVYHHLSHAVARWFFRFLHRILNMLYRLLLYPCVLLIRGQVLSALWRMGVLACAVLFCVLGWQSRIPQRLGYAVQYAGQTVAYVADYETAQAGYVRAEQMMYAFDMRDTPKVSRAVVSDSDLSDVVAVSEAIVAVHSDNLTTAEGLFLDGNFIGAVVDKQALEDMLESLRTAKDDGTESKPSAFAQKVEISHGAYPHEGVVTVGALQQKLTASKKAPVYYTVQSGDNLTRIAKRHDLTLTELRKLNPAFSASDLLHIGDKLLVREASALLQVNRFVKQTYTEAIPFETKIYPDPNHFTYESRVAVRGKNGSQRVTAEICYTDGIETARTVLESTVLQKPTTQKKLVGTRRGNRYNTYVIGDGKATGTFVWPTPSLRTITSYYGRRWGTVHKGLDISGISAQGKAIVAADGGTVYAVNNSHSWGTGMFAGYGYAVIIDHGNGLRTLYAHCSKIAVRAGQKVSRGQTIAYVGNTGYSTGPHLHFEVRVNNTRVNPLPYLKK